MKKIKMAPYVFILPFFIIFVIFAVVPLFYSLWLSFYKISFVWLPPEFVGLKNYIVLLFKDARFLHSLKIAFITTGSQLALQMPLAVILALLLNFKIKGRNIFRMMYFLPVVTSLVVAALIFRLVFNYDVGIVNIFLRAVGFPGYKWLLDPRLALFSLNIVIAWRWTGFHMVIQLAGLQGIPEELYEAARIDGASSLQVIWYITLPQLFPVILFSLTICLIGTLQLFDEAYVLPGGGPAAGGPADATLTPAVYLYKVGFTNLKLGYASAMGYIVGFIVIVSAVTQIKALAKRAELT